MKFRTLYSGWPVNRRLLSLGLLFVVLAVTSYFISRNSGSAYVDPDINFSIGVAGVCNSDAAGSLPTTCTEAAGATFTMNLNLTSIPSGFVYISYDTSVAYSGVTVVSNSLNSLSGVAPCFYSNGNPYISGPGYFLQPCFVSSSSYTGVLYHIDFHCPPTAPSSPATVTLANSGTDVVDPQDIEHGEGPDESLAITCGSTPFTFTPTPTRTFTPTPTRTFTPTPTPTPTTIPHQGNIFPVAGGAPSPLDAPQGIARASDGSLYVADTNHCQVLHVQENGTFVVTAGTGTCGYSAIEDNGPAVSAMLNGPSDVALDNAGNLYIADRLNHRVRKVATGTITTVAGNGSTNYGVCTDGSSATGPCLSQPMGVWVDSGNNLYIASWGSHRVMRVSGSTITTFAGNGIAGLCADGSAPTGACLSGPWDVVGDNGGNIYISNNGNHTVGRVNGGMIYTAAGNGTAGSCASGSSAIGICLNLPAGIDLNGADLYIASTGDGLIRHVNSGFIYTDASGLTNPIGVAVGTGGDLYFSEGAAGAGRVGLLYGGTIDTIVGPSFCGDGFVAITSSCLHLPGDVALDQAGNVYIADPGNHRVRLINASDAHIATLAGKTEQTNCPVDSGGAANLCLAYPQHIAVSAVSATNGSLYIGDRDGNRLWQVDLSTDSVVRIAGAGDGSAGLCGEDTNSLNACLDYPAGLALQQVSGTDRYLFIAEQGNNGRVLRIDLSANPPTVRTVLNDGQVTADVALGPDRSLYVAEPNAHSILRLAPGSNGVVDGAAFDGTEGSPVRVAGTGTAGLATDGMVATVARLNSPTGVEVDADGHLLISDTGNHRLWVVTEPTPVLIDGVGTELIYRVAGGGSPSPGFCGDPTTKATPTPPNPHNARGACLNGPAGLSYDNPNAALYFADEGNNRVRKIPSDCDADGLTDKAETTGLVLKSGLTPWASPAPMTPTPLPGTAGTDTCKSDTDGDGCTDAQEVGPSQLTGGRRDPTNPWDYMNPTHDRKNRSDDILVVVRHYQKNRYLASPPNPPNTLNPDYNIDTDRTNIGPNVWNLGPPNGMVTSADILAMVKQFAHDCA